MNELQSLAQIFQNRLFRIPDYQRGYAWQTPQLRDFWEDLINLQPDRFHYTGLLSIKPMNSSELKRLGNEDCWLLSNGYKAYQVVDGQQRLTTFVILLNEILEFLRALPENQNKTDDEIYIGYENLKDIQSRYIRRSMPPSGLIVTYMFSYENDNPSAEYLKYKILGQKHAGSLQETYYTKNLKRAKRFFADAVYELYQAGRAEAIEAVFQKLTLHFMFNIHEIEDDYDVFVAFETMNNRGKKLSNLELLKNRLIYLTTLYNPAVLPPAGEAALREKINAAWKEIYYQIGRNKNEPLSDDDFLRAHWIAYFTYTRKKGTDYIDYLLNRFSGKSIFSNTPAPLPDDDSTFPSDVDEGADEAEAEAEETPGTASASLLRPGDLADYVDSLKETAQFWYYSFYPYECDFLTAEEQIWMDRLNRIGIAYFRPLAAISLMQNLGITVQERIDFLAAVERFIFVFFRMAQYQANYKSSDFNRKAHDLYRKAIPLSSLTKDLNQWVDSSLINSVDSFGNRMQARFDSREGFYSWRDLRYVLYEYEYELAKKYKIEKLDWAVLTKVVKDRVTVEHILPQTPSKYYWRNQFRQFSPDEVRLLTNSIGNLLPLSQSINSRLQNDSFDEKKKRGYYNGCHSEIEVSKESDWNAEAIYRRGMRILDFMEKRWNIQFRDARQKEDILHISFVTDGRAVPPELDNSIEEPEPQTDPENPRTAYWTYALPVIRAAFGNVGSYSNVNPSESNYKDGGLGLSGVHLYCSICAKPAYCLAGIWINVGDPELTAKVYHILLSHREQIDALASFPLQWNGDDSRKSCSIDAVLSSVDFKNPQDWEPMAAFQAKMAKELSSIVFSPYENEIRAIL